MLLRPHQALQIEQRRVGPERTPLLIIDSLVDDPDRLVRKAQRAHFAPQGAYFPGLRARAPLSYEAFVEQALSPLLRECFGLPAGRLHFPMCHYSLVTLAPERLQPLQQIPHVDSTDSLGLASVHYLFKGPWDGTDFYRHRATGLSVIDAELRRTQGGALDGNQALGVPEFTANANIEWDTPFFPGFTLTGRVLHTDKQYFDAANTLSIPSWTRFDLGARYVFAAGDTPVTLRFNVDNVADKNYWASAFGSFGGQLVMGLPRTFKASITADF